MKKRLSKKIHKRFLEDIAEEITFSSLWRNEIFNLAIDQWLLISMESTIPLPNRIKPYFCQYNLHYVLRVLKPDHEDIVDMVKANHGGFVDGLLINEFTPKLYPKIKRYTAYRII